MLSNADLKEALEEPCMDIVSAVSRVLEETPAELLADIQQDGMTLCGGVSGAQRFGYIAFAFLWISCACGRKWSILCGTWNQILLELYGSAVGHD